MKNDELKNLLKDFNTLYEQLYNSEDEDKLFFLGLAQYSEEFADLFHKDEVREFTKFRGDGFTSDREQKALILALLGNGYIKIK